MATTQNLHIGNGTQTAYSFTFPYIDQADVKVELNGALTTAYTFANATTILFNSAPANGVLIDIYRDTDVDSVKAQFASGNAIKAQDLNKNFEQVLFATQEDENRVGNFQSQIDVAVATANTASSNATTALNTANSISSSKLSLTGGTMSGDIAMGSQKVTNLADPTANQDAATKNYVDTQDALKLDLTGGNLTGNLGLGNNRIYSLGSPLFADEAATKGYVDNAIVLVPKLPLSGGVMSGDIGFNNTYGTVNMVDPTNAQDGATKNYVDTQDATKLDLAGGNLTGNLGLGNNRIYSLGSPLFADEAATKGYVDNAIVLIPKLPLTGGTMSGDISFGNSGYGTVDMVDPTNAQDGATKNYVDTQNSTQDTAIAAKLPLAGGTMSGAINMGSNLINNVTDPVSAQDAATKNYVDTANSTQDTAIAAKLPLAGGTMTGNITFNAGQTIDGYVVETSATGSAEIPAGTTLERDASPSAGYIRFNTTSTQFEGYNGTVWTNIGAGSGGGGATGGGTDQWALEHDNTITTSYTISTGKNVISAGPLTINAGATITVPSGSNWVIV